MATVHAEKSLWTRKNVTNPLRTSLCRNNEYLIACAHLGGGRENAAPFWSDFIFLLFIYVIIN